ncbi:uncharacterized protein DAT39_018350 [Clarias magur]|uniref:Uncharacterized protein n=1 Tax=Clarias magur TaxID=1594786 RepID=A0A8J4WT43_CLAMG|nr:uncharacterized protein DAT39_018350 [Clarias magur]
MTGLANQLPDLCNGAQKWITQLEEKTIGHLLAIGDVKAILAQTIGKVKTTEILNEAGLQAAIGQNAGNSIAFGAFRNKVWNALRKAYPTKMYPGKLESVTLKEDENVVKFINDF